MTVHQFFCYGTCHAENSHILIVCRNREKLVFFVYIFVNYIPAWCVVLRIYVALVIFQPNCDLEAGDNQSLRS